MHRPGERTRDAGFSRIPLPSNSHHRRTASRGATAWRALLPGALPVALTVAALLLAPRPLCGQAAAGRPGGAAVIAQTAEPRTLNPLLASDQPSRDLIYALSADLVHINRATLRPEPALAKSWKLSSDGRHYTLVLRDGLRFSDGAPLTADDVVFTFQVYLDPELKSPQRDLLLIDGKPVVASRVSANTVRVDLPAAYAPGERLFDSVWILPKHKLDKARNEARLAQAWGIGAPPTEFATAGPFRFRQYVPGQRVVLERNPYYWKKDERGQPLPYLDRLEIVFAPDQNAQLLRLMSGQAHAAARLRHEDFAALQKNASLRALDAGAGLEYNFLFFNWSAAGPQRDWFRSLKFRQAVAHAIDRDAIVRLVYHGRGSALWSQVTPGNQLWRTPDLRRYPYDSAQAAALLGQAGFRRQGSGPLLDSGGREVAFSLMVSASNQLRRKMATLVQEDLGKVGIRVNVVPTEFGTMTNAVLNTRNFDAALWGIVSGDVDPNAEMNVWTSGGTLHVWDLRPQGTPEPWQQEVDKLMSAQRVTLASAARKKQYDGVQRLLSENLPVIFLVSPHVLAACQAGLENCHPAILEPVLIWNCERFFRSR